MGTPTSRGEQSMLDEPIFDLATKCEKLYSDQINRLEAIGKRNEMAVLEELGQRFAA